MERNYDVTLHLVSTATMHVRAESREEAEDIAWSLLTDSGFARYQPFVEPLAYEDNAGHRGTSEPNYHEQIKIVLVELR